jgi:type VI secretion system protein VasI
LNYQTLLYDVQIRGQKGMYCSKCGAENLETSSFCTNCGQAINGTAIPTPKKRNKIIWIVSSIIAIFLFCCVAPISYGYIKYQSIPTATLVPSDTPEPTETPIPTDIAMPSHVVVNYTRGNCAPVYHDDYGSIVDCIPNGEVLKVISNGPLTSRQRQFWTIRWILEEQLRFAGYIKREDVSPLYAGDSTPTPIPTGKWITTFNKSPFDDSQTVILSLNANFPVTGWINDTKVPLLVVQCREKKTDVYIKVGMAQNVETGLYNQSTVRVRFDSDEAEDVITDHSTDNESLFFHDPNAFINKMLQHEKLTFGFIPFNSSSVETSFDLHGLSEAIKPLQEVCK